MSERTNGEAMIVAEDVEKWFAGFQALRGVSTTVRRGEVVVIVGPSGSGKSTFIRTINRLERHDKGRIVVDGIELTDDIRNIERIRSEIGIVFQSFNLFPHLRVVENLTLAPRNVRRWPRAKAEEKARQLLERVGIPEQARKYPSPGPWSWSPRSCCSTSPPPPSIPR
jgi:general L-amino acid transport system ATP-binding protein